MFFQTLSRVFLLFLTIFPRQSTQAITFSQVSYFQVEEDTNTGEKIGEFTVSGGDSLNVESRTDYVTINSTVETGGKLRVEVFLNFELDRDYGVEKYTLVFEATDSEGSSKQKTVLLIVNDVNDETPQWLNRPYSVNVKEDADVDTAIYREITISDPDNDDDWIFTLSAGSDSTFSIDTVSQPKSAILKLETSLDFETKSFYQYSVTVKDKVNHKATAEVFITVEDVQDTPPKFDRDSYRFTVSENTQKGTSLQPAVGAIDGDRGVPNEISLSIFNESCPGLLSIDATSGQLSVDKSPDRDSGIVFDSDGICVLFIQASEMGPVQTEAPHTSLTSVTVTVTDENDLGPMFSLPTYKASIDEGAQAGVPIIMSGEAVTIKDSDQGTNAKFSVKITSPLEVFEITPSNVQGSAEIQIKVLNATAIDFEERESITIKLTATDEANGKSSSAEVDLTIKNVNDHIPVFDSAPYKANVPENSAVGASVITIHATDGDAKDPLHNFNEVTYSFDRPSSFFKIDEATGEVSVANKNLDREKQNSYYLNVVAKDGGGLKTSSPLAITISDVNDQPPVIKSRQYQTSLEEESTDLMSPVQVEASDDDEPNTKNSDITYSLVTTSPDNLLDHFSIDSENGTLTVVKSLLYENVFLKSQQGTIILTVEATDKGATPLSSSVQVFVSLEDKNNQSPQCNLPLTDVTISENLARSKVALIEATDADGTDPNNQIMYTLDEASRELFTIDSTSGEIKTWTGLDYETEKSHLITVKVRDLGSPPNSNTCQVKVQVSDVNDVPPKFDDKNMVKSTDENKKFSATCSANDQDEDSDLKYSIIWSESTFKISDDISKTFDQPRTDLVTLDENSCALTIEPLDREAFSFLMLKLRVDDNNGAENTPQYDTATLSIKVMDLNDNKPDFIGGPTYTSTIKENLPEGSLISLNNGLSLKVSDQDADAVNSQFELQLLTFSTTFGIEPSSGTSSQAFNIIVINSTEIDFEKYDNMKLELEVIETGTKDSFHNYATVELTILNENDNSPSFNQSSYEAIVPENSPPNFAVMALQATDEDKDDPKNAYNKVTYSFDRVNQFFEIDQDSGVVKVTSDKLDRETQDLFYLTVIAEDGGERKESCVLTIRVTDINDNDPVFRSLQYETSVQENSTELRRSLQVEATDADEGKNSEVVYSLVSASPDGVLEYFSIDPKDGTLSVLKPILYKDIPFHADQEGIITLTVKATDGGDVPNSASVPVLVRLEDLNNNIPRCDSDSYTVTVKENLKNFQIIEVNATDEDGTPPNNRFMFSIDQASSDHFIIDSTSGKIATRAGLDFESSNSHQIEVTVTDLGSPPMSSTCQVDVQVSDVNDVTPAFDDIKEMEKEEGTEFTYSCSAKDPDSNDELIYSIDWSLSKMQGISGPAVPVDTSIQNLVQLDGKKCAIIVQPLDREIISKLDLALQVVDKNAEENTPQEDKVHLVISVLDVNDKEPVFVDGGRYTANIRENMPPETFIKFDKVNGIAVQDEDADESHSRFEVKLLTYNTTFKVEPSQGTFSQTFSIAVQDSAKLDFEDEEEFSLQLQVLQIDTEKAFSSIATVDLRIENVNDNFPYFKKPSYEATIPEGSSHNTPIEFIKAEDDDRGVFGQLTYSFQEDCGMCDMFSIDETTGQVNFSSGQLDFEAGPITYSLAVLATDGGNFTTSTQLVIVVQDINDNPPIFIPPLDKEVRIDENQQYFYPSLIIQARDMDAPGSKNSQIVYSLQVGDGKLSNHLFMNEDTGEITINKPFDFEALDPEQRKKIDLVIDASDMGVPTSRSSSLSLSLIVVDVNDESPQFEKTSYSTSVPENIEEGHILLTIHADDKDATFNEIIYSLDSASLAMFEIDLKLGELKTRKTLDWERDDSYSVVVTATDNGTPPKMNTATVTISVTDVNDTPPQFSWETKTLNKKEGWATELATNSASDQDSNHSLEYSIVWEDSSGVNGDGNYMKGKELKPFIKINETTGEVSPKEPLDREKVQQFQLALAVEDMLAAPGSAQIDTALLRIIVEDENDMKPEFEGPKYIEARVKETAQVGTALMFVNFSVLVFNDADGESNNVYTIAIEGDDFSVSPTDGIGKTSCSIYVKNTNVLDYEKNHNLTLVVTATENPEHSTSITIRLVIENENDNIPKFEKDHYEAHVLENAPEGTTITTMTATDEDDGDFGELTYFIDGDQSRFLINNLTGEITLNTKDLDYEITPSYLITVGVQDGGKAVTTTRLTVFVDDVNDNLPKFEGLPYVFEIFEGSTDPQRALVVRAVDQDKPDTDRSRVEYIVEKVVTSSVDKDSFYLNSTTGELSVQSPLDYESLLSSKGKILVEVIAADFGQPPLSSTATISVQVLDRNDVTAKFSEDNYIATVQENSPPETFVTSVTAHDDDGTEPNNDIYYVIGSGGQDKFQMNSSSGELMVGTGANLDREETNTYTLTVLAIDKGSPPMTGTATVKVTIEDVNDASPVLTNIPDPLHVTEDAPERSEITQLTATDEDSDKNLEFSLVWEESQAFDEKGQYVNISLVQDWFNISATTGVLMVSSKLDRELAQQIILKAQVNDTASVKEKVPQIDTVVLDILMDDVNDNAPAIASCDEGMEIHVSEATQTDTEITTFSATDKDKQQIISFSLENERHFNISSSGKLLLYKLLDRESQSTVNFTVIATDSGSPAQTSECEVHVIVEDANDNDPQFTTTDTDFSVSENADNGTYVGQITAEDKDEGGKGRVTFDFMNNINSAFAIDDTGKITVKGKLDRESVPLYSLTVIASDNPENQVLEQKRATTKLIHIKVLDENDQTPEFQTGNADSFSGVLSEKKKLDDVVSIVPKQIFASDGDEGKNAEIIYSFKDASDSYFRIDPNSGQVVVNQDNLNGLAGEYRYEVVATDQGQPPLSATANLTITVLDENINSPKFVSKGPVAAIPECIKPGSSIYTFQATDDDKDKETNGKVIYELDTETSTKDWKFFSIDRSSGVLKTTNPLDREKKEQLLIQVKALDQGEPSFTTLSGLITIDVTDINDHPPDFNHLRPEDVSFSIAEGPQPDGAEIGTIKAQDQDSNATLTYELQESAWADHFRIESDNNKGIIRLKKPLDRETIDSLTLYVVAIDTSSLSAGGVCGDTPNTDTDNSLRSEPLPIKVLVEDVDDNPPVFMKKSLSKGFLSSTEFGTEIASLPVYVNDEDTKKNSFHSFYQQGKLEPSSEILKGWSKEQKPDPIKVEVNGSVVTNFKFPENINGQFKLRIKANDSAGSDFLDLDIYIVGSSQVVYLTFYLSENDMMTEQVPITDSLSSALPYTIVPDNILPFYNKDGSVDGSKSVLAVHALDKTSGSVISGESLLNEMDTSRAVNNFLQQYKILKTETAEAASSTDEGDDGRMQYILAAVIVLIAFAFIVTLIVLLNNIQRFKRKLKAATLEVHAMGVVEQDQFPGLDNKIKSSNPVFMRDDVSLDDLGDDVSQHSDFSGKSANSLDQNEVDQVEGNGAPMSQGNRMEAEEQEVTLDLQDRIQPTNNHRHLNPYDNLAFPHRTHRQSDAEVPQALQFLNAALEGEEDVEGENMAPNPYQNTQYNGGPVDEDRFDRKAKHKNVGDGGHRNNGSRYQAETDQDNMSFGYHVESTEI